MSKKLISIVIIVAAMFIQGVSTAQAAHISENGIVGKVKQVICSENRSGSRIKCDDKFVQTTLIVQTVSGQEISRITTTDRGKFKINLPVGTYRIVSTNPSLTAFPGMVTVNDDKYTRVKIFLNGNITLSL